MMSMLFIGIVIIGGIVYYGLKAANEKNPSQNKVDRIFYEEMYSDRYSTR